MNIFITGKNGFIGNALTKYLYEINLKHNIFCLNRDFSFEGNCYTPNQSILFNCAWAGVLGKHRNSESIQNENLVYTKKLIEFCKKYNIQRIIAFGSQAEYSPTNELINENSLIKPYTKYGEIKVKVHYLLSNYANNSDCKLTWLRLFDIYGPGDNPNWLIPYVISTLLKGECPVLTRCTQIWDYLYVDDVVKALLSFLKYKSKNKVENFNLCSGEHLKLRTIIEIISHIINNKNSYPLFGKKDFRQNEIHSIRGVNNLLSSKINWNPETSIIQGLKQTVEFYKESSC